MDEIQRNEPDGNDDLNECPVIDTLPYVDPMCDDDMRMKIDRMLKEEMRESLLESTKCVMEVLDSEWSGGDTEKQRNYGMTKEESWKYLDLDVALSEWKEEWWKVKKAYEYERNVEERLELLQEFGSNAWIVHNRSLEQVLKRLKNELERTRCQIEKENLKRKSEQWVAHGEIVAIEKRWLDLVNKNVLIDEACQKMQREMDEWEERMRFGKQECVN